MMKTMLAAVGTCVLLLGLSSCSGKVETTDDSLKMELETPKIETNSEDVDMDPATDDDVDIDSPAPGDT